MIAKCPYCKKEIEIYEGLTVRKPKKAMKAIMLKPVKLPKSSMEKFTEQLEPLLPLIIEKIKQKLNEQPSVAPKS